MKEIKAGRFFFLCFSLARHSARTCEALVTAAGRRFYKPRANLTRWRSALTSLWNIPEQIKFCWRVCKTAPSVQRVCFRCVFFANFFVRGLFKSELESPEGSGVADYNLWFLLNRPHLLFHSQTPLKRPPLLFIFIFQVHFFCFVVSHVPSSRIPAPPSSSLPHYLHLQPRDGQRQSMQLPSKRRLINFYGSLQARPYLVICER